MAVAQSIKLYYKHFVSEHIKMFTQVMVFTPAHILKLATSWKSTDKFKLGINLKQKCKYD